MILYHFPTSPFARRVRLALALKGLSAELRDARAEAGHREAVERLNPQHTVPVLIDGERVFTDSNAICQYLERKVPTPKLVPPGIEGAEAFELSALCDGVISGLSNLGMRYFGLHKDAHFPEVKARLGGRVQRALDALGARVEGVAPGPLCGAEWSLADIAIYTTTAWLEALPARGATFPPAAQVVSLGWVLPSALSRWADQHRQRADVLALG